MKNEEQLADCKDPLFKFLEKSYARQYLTYVIFSAAIILALLAEWEFVNNRIIGEWTVLVGIMVGISGILAPILWYVHTTIRMKQQEEVPCIQSDNNHRLSILTNLPDILGMDRKEQKVTITVMDVKSKKPIPNVIIRGRIDYNPINKMPILVAKLEEDVTDCTGQCSYTWPLGDWKYGNYTLKIAVSAKGYKTNVLTQQDFEVAARSPALSTNI